MSESPDIDEFTYECAYSFCDKAMMHDINFSMDGRYCARASRIQEHFHEVATIIMLEPELVTLVVGQEKVKIRCHKALLGLKSDYFDAVCYGGYASADADEIEVQEENPQAIEEFVFRLYSGQLHHSKLPLVELWLLGDRLRSPQFTNEVICMLFNRSKERSIRARNYQFMFANTTPDLKLRRYFRDVILCQGPLNEDKHYRQYADRDEWLELIHQGGELVVEIATRGSFFTNTEYEECPHSWTFHHKYLEPISTRPIEDFVMDKPREGTR